MWIWYSLAAGLAVMVCGVLGGAFSWISAGYLTRRRPPDAPDTPANHGLPYEVVHFPSRYKAQIEGWWIPREQARGTLILCHGQNGSMDADISQALPLYQAGYNILMFNFRAHGQSEGKFVTFGVFEKEDLLGAIDFLHREKGIERVGVIGFSMGAAVAMIAAALTDKIAVLVLDGVFYKFLHTLEAWWRQHYAFPPLDKLLAQMMIIGASVRTNTRMFQVSPRLWAKHIRDVPTLFIHAERDTFVTQAQIEQLAHDLQAPSKIWIAPDAAHRQAYHQHPDAYMAEVLAWLEQHYS